ncbi:MAG: DUF3306 domain-containing protein [Aurantimonas endophytica]|uniref:DUF3306 domain-containing protein n=1 Tax=Aurantimonas endophytica TaxID=1522175 RepID=A0A7W6HB63_9HYPH|nr:DUF3306 domain-containing protein [Aurantimonas endophytica]MBB4002005.1 hypothetical protein [Aurantimonas endophytica]MCO6402362.1 DUF3306 domain-containing protein [Aurantimonas endophytica]
MSNDFFARWSRRKLEDASPEPDEAIDAPSQTGDSPTPTFEADASGNAITDEELAALPDPDAVTTWSDITGFLRQGVPLALRNRALRRIWSLDPSIRDYIGDARDYAWDWNTPGGMPLSGPLSATTDVGKIVRGLYEPAPEAPVREPEALPEREELIESLPDRGTGNPPAAYSEPDRPALPDVDPGPDDQLPVARATRHGGALPS